MKPDGKCVIEVSQEGDPELEPGMTYYRNQRGTDQSYCWRLLRQVRCRREWCYIIVVFSILSFVLYLFVSFIDGKKDKTKIYNYY